MKFIIQILLTLTILTIGNSAHALDETTVVRWIDTLGAIDSWAGDHNHPIEAEIRTLDEPRDIDLERVWSDEFLKTQQVRNLIEDHGFDTIEEWKRTSSHVFGTYLSLKMRSRLEAAKIHNDEYRKEIDAHPEISPEQKKELLAQIDAQEERLRQLAHRAPEKDVVILQPHMERMSGIIEGSR